MNTDPITVEQVYPVPISLLWQAITDPDQMRRWFFAPMMDFKPEVGFETQFDVECEGQIYSHLWKVTEVVPETKISYDWRYGGHPGESSVTWELSKTPNGTRLRLTHTGTETFPRDNPIFSREAGEAGWKYFLHDSLKAFLAQRAS